MWRALQRWWMRWADRRGAARRGAGAWGYEPHYRHSGFRKARLASPEAAALAVRWARRGLWLALLAGLLWFAWESWRGLRIFGE